MSFSTLVISHTVAFMLGAWVVTYLAAMRKLSPRSTSIPPRLTNKTLKKAAHRFSAGDVIVHYDEPKETWEKRERGTSKVLEVGDENYRLAPWCDCAGFIPAEFKEHRFATQSIRGTDRDYELETEAEKATRESESRQLCQKRAEELRKHEELLKHIAGDVQATSSNVFPVK